MTNESPRSGLRRSWPFVLVITLLIAGYGLLQYALKEDPSMLRQHVEMCTADYKHAPTARDTAEIDALTPPEIGYVRQRQMRTCGYYRKAGATN